MANDVQHLVIEFVVRSSTTQQNRIVMWELPPLLNTYSSHLSTEVGGDDYPHL